MASVKMRAELLDSTKDALEVIYAACRQCYSSDFAYNIFKKGQSNKEETAKFVKQVIASGHESPLEHVKFTFAIEGVSRALTHQLVRHRLASYSQQSQRYVKASDFGYIIPPSMENNPEMKKEFLSTMQTIQKSYDKLIKLFEQNSKKGEKANQDARFVLPQASETKIVVTMNVRELLHFFKERCCTRAQWEIRSLANKMLEICKKTLPEVFADAGEKCVSLNYCPEGQKFSCGKFPTKKK